MSALFYEIKQRSVFFFPSGASLKLPNIKWQGGSNYYYSTGYFLQNISTRRFLYPAKTTLHNYQNAGSMLRDDTETSARESVQEGKNIAVGVSFDWGAAIFLTGSAVEGVALNFEFQIFLP